MCHMHFNNTVYFIEETHLNNYSLIICLLKLAWHSSAHFLLHISTMNQFSHSIPSSVLISQQPLTLPRLSLYNHNRSAKQMLLLHLSPNLRPHHEEQGWLGQPSRSKTIHRQDLWCTKHQGKLESSQCKLTLKNEDCDELQIG